MQKARRSLAKRSSTDKKHLQRGTELTPDQMNHVADPSVRLRLDADADVKAFEPPQGRIAHEKFSLEWIGKSLIAARIARGWSQKDLADKLGVSESKIARDEHNEYHGLLLVNLRKIAVLLGVKLETAVKLGKTGLSNRNSSSMPYFRLALPRANPLPK